MFAFLFVELIALIATTNAYNDGKYLLVQNTAAFCMLFTRVRTVRMYIKIGFISHNSGDFWEVPWICNINHF